MSRKKFQAGRQILQAFLLFSAYRKTVEIEEIIKALEEEKDKSEFSRIRCPHCSWQPGAGSLWCCADSGAPEYFYGACWTNWHTFKTRGLCPGCNHQWRWTSCLRCHAWSRHEDWYAGTDN